MRRVSMCCMALLAMCGCARDLCGPETGDGVQEVVLMSVSRMGHEAAYRQMNMLWKISALWYIVAARCGI